MEHNLVEEVKKSIRDGSIKRIRKAIVGRITKLVEDANEQSGYNKALYETLDEDTQIPNFRMPQHDVLLQPSGKGSTIVVHLNPNSSLARRLMEEEQYRYHAVWDYSDRELTHGNGEETRSEALFRYLNSYGVLKGKVRLGEDMRGPAIYAPNIVLDMDFVTIREDGKFNLQRFTNENVAHVCKVLNVSFYQTKK